MSDRAVFLQDLQKVIDLFDDDHLDALAEVDRVIAEGFQENFYNTLDHESQPWAARKDNLPHPLLIKTGKMFAAATNPSDPGHVFEVEGNVVIFGVNDEVVPYAKYHHRGTENADGSVKMVARRFAYATLQTQQRAFDTFIEFVDAKLDAL